MGRLFVDRRSDRRDHDGRRGGLGAHHNYRPGMMPGSASYPGGTSEPLSPSSSVATMQIAPPNPESPAAPVEPPCDTTNAQTPPVPRVGETPPLASNQPMQVQTPEPPPAQPEGPCFDPERPTITGPVPPEYQHAVPTRANVWPPQPFNPFLAGVPQDEDATGVGQVPPGIPDGPTSVPPGLIDPAAFGFGAPQEGEEPPATGVGAPQEETGLGGVGAIPSPHPASTVHLPPHIAPPPAASNTPAAYINQAALQLQTGYQFLVASNYPAAVAQFTASMQSSSQAAKLLGSALPPLGPIPPGTPPQVVAQYMLNEAEADIAAVQALQGQQPGVLLPTGGTPPSTGGGGGGAGGGGGGGGHGGGGGGPSPTGTGAAVPMPHPASVAHIAPPPAASQSALQQELQRALNSYNAGVADIKSGNWQLAIDGFNAAIQLCQQLAQQIGATLPQAPSPYPTSGVYGPPYLPQQWAMVLQTYATACLQVIQAHALTYAPVIRPTGPKFAGTGTVPMPHPASMAGRGVAGVPEEGTSAGMNTQQGLGQAMGPGKWTVVMFRDMPRTVIAALAGAQAKTAQIRTTSGLRTIIYAEAQVQGANWQAEVQVDSKNAPYVRNDTWNGMVRSGGQGQITYYKLVSATGMGAPMHLPSSSQPTQQQVLLGRATTSYKAAVGAYNGGDWNRAIQGFNAALSLCQTVAQQLGIKLPVVLVQPTQGMSPQQQQAINAQVQALKAIQTLLARIPTPRYPGHAGLGATPYPDSTGVLAQLNAVGAPSADQDGSYYSYVLRCQTVGQSAATKLGPDIDSTYGIANTGPNTQAAFTANAPLQAVNAQPGTAVAPATPSSAGDATQAQQYIGQMLGDYNNAITAGQAAQNVTPPPPPPGTTIPANVVADAQAVAAAITASSSACTDVASNGTAVNTAVHNFKTDWNTAFPNNAVPINTSQFEAATAAAVAQALSGTGTTAPAACAGGVTPVTPTKTCPAGYVLQNGNCVQQPAPTPTPANQPAAKTNWTPWIIGGAAVIGAGLIGWAVMSKPKSPEQMRAAAEVEMKQLPAASAEERMTYQDRLKLPDSAFALPELRNRGKGGLPLTNKRGHLDPKHVANAAARLSMMRNRGSVTHAQYEKAKKKIIAAACKTGVEDTCRLRLAA